MILYHNHPHRRIYRSNRTESIFHRPLASPEYAHLVFLRWLMLFALTLLRSVYLRPLFQKAALLFSSEFLFQLPQHYCHRLLPGQKLLNIQTQIRHVLICHDGASRHQQHFRCLYALHQSEPDCCLQMPQRQQFCHPFHRQVY